MTKREAATLVGWAAANFPSMQDKNLRPTAELWHKMLSDVDYQVAEKALIKVLATARFFPTVGEIREAVADLTVGRPMTALEAWGLVCRAIQRYGSYQEREAMASLPADVVAVVRRFGWREMCACEEPDVIRGQFRRAWEASAGEAREMAVMPAPIREMIKACSNAKALPEPEPVPRIASLAGTEPVAAENIAFMHLERIKKSLKDMNENNEEESKKAAMGMLVELAALRKAAQR